MKSKIAIMFRNSEFITGPKVDPIAILNAMAKAGGLKVKKYTKLETPTDYDLLETHIHYMAECE